MLQVCYFLNKAVVALDNKNLNICSLLQLILWAFWCIHT